MPTFIFSTHLLISELVATSLFEFGQSPVTITEVFRGGHTLEWFMGVSLASSVLSKDIFEEFAWLVCAICEFCSMLDTLSDITSSKNRSAIISSGAISACVLRVCNSSMLFANGLVAWNSLDYNDVSLTNNKYSHSLKLIFTCTVFAAQLS